MSTLECSLCSGQQRVKTQKVRELPRGLSEMSEFCVFIFSIS